LIDFKRASELEELPVNRLSRRDFEPSPRPSKAKDRILLPFVAWDGEGMNVDGEHRYVYLANSLGHELFDPAGIPTLTALELMSAAVRDSAGIHVIYGGSYDANMILRDISYVKLKQLWEGFPEWTWFRDYSITYRLRKLFAVRALGTPRYREAVVNGKKRREFNFVSHCRLWDVIGFFQSPFVVALEKWLGEDYTDLAEIRNMKERRSDFNLSEIDAIRHYTQCELRALVALMTRLREHAITANLMLNRWDGAGAVASALLRREGVKRFMTVCPLEVRRAVQHGYAGGRVELYQYGRYKGTVYHYDINSAYPYAMTFLPALKGGRWELDENADYREPFSLSYIRWHSRHTDKGIYPFFFRDVNNAIYYPPSGEGWHWEPELQAAIAAHRDRRWNGDFDVLRTWNFYADSQALPFSFIPAVYNLRLRWKREGNPAERFLKLGPNSLYGKMAQQLSRLYRDEETGAIRHEKPPYHQLEWAGWVTAFTRAKLFQLAMTNPDAIIFVSTDGIFSIEPLDVGSIGDGLGEWTHDTADGIVVVQNGVYWLWKDGKIHEKYRGFDPQSLKVGDVLGAWKRSEHRLNRTDTRFVGMGSVCSNPRLRRHWRTWRRYPHNLELEPYGSRISTVSFVEWKGALNPANRLIRTEAADLMIAEESQPFPVSFLDEEWHAATTIDGVPSDIIRREREDSYA
jgi:DNA polymerase type B, organellar and viral